MGDPREAEGRDKREGFGGAIAPLQREGGAGGPKTRSGETCEAEGRDKRGGCGGAIAPPPRRGAERLAQRRDWVIRARPKAGGVGR